MTHTKNINIKHNKKQTEKKTTNKQQNSKWYKFEKY